MKHPTLKFARGLALAVFCLLCTALHVAPASAERPDAAQVFQALRALEGRWVGRWADGQEHSVDYRLTAGGSVLVETWTLSPTRESITLYYLDGDRLLATHFCPQGNQPRLRFASVSPDGALNFRFQDATNISVRGRSHQHAFWIRLLDANRFERAEVYVPNESRRPEPDEPWEAVTYSRVVQD